MSSTGYISSGSANTSCYNASGSNSSGNVSHPAVNIHQILLNKCQKVNPNKLEIKLYEGGVVTRTVMITSPRNLAEQAEPVFSAFTSLFESDVDTSHDSFVFKNPPGLKHSTPNPLPATTAETGSSDLFSTPQVSDESREAQAVPMQMVKPLLIRPDALEQVSEGSDTDDMIQLQDTPVESQFDHVFDSLDIKEEPQKVMAGVVPLSQPLLCLPLSDTFKDQTFVLTCKVDRTDSGELDMAGYRKDEYIRCITAGGGHVVDDVTDSLNPANTVLLSDSPCTTKNFLHALILGISCVRVEWIDHCCAFKMGHDETRFHRIPDKLLLHRGTSIVTGECINQSKDNYTPGLFCEHVIYLQGSVNFKNKWSRLIESGGGRSIKRSYRDSSLKPDLVVSDETKKLSKTSHNFGVPIVNQDWLIESIIQGELCGYEPFQLNSW